MKTGAAVKEGWLVGSGPARRAPVLVQTRAARQAKATRRTRTPGLALPVSWMMLAGNAACLFASMMLLIAPASGGPALPGLVTGLFLAALAAAFSPKALFATKPVFAALPALTLIALAALTPLAEAIAPAALLSAALLPAFALASFCLQSRLADLGPTARRAVPYGACLTAGAAAGSLAAYMLQQQGVDSTLLVAAALLAALMLRPSSASLLASLASAPRRLMIIAALAALPGLVRLAAPESILPVLPGALTALILIALTAGRSRLTAPAALGAAFFLMIGV